MTVIQAVCRRPVYHHPHQAHPHHDLKIQRQCQRYHQQWYNRKTKLSDVRVLYAWCDRYTGHWRSSEPSRNGQVDGHKSDTRAIQIFFLIDAKNCNSFALILLFWAYFEFFCSLHRFVCVMYVKLYALSGIIWFLFVFFFFFDFQSVVVVVGTRIAWYIWNNYVRWRSMKIDWGNSRNIRELNVKITFPWSQYQ